MRNTKPLIYVIIVLLLISIIQLTLTLHWRGVAIRSAQEPPIAEHPLEDPDPCPNVDCEETPVVYQRVMAHYGDNQRIMEQEIREMAYTKYGMELLNQELDHRVMQLEAEALGIQIHENELQQELLRMQAGYDSEEDFFRVMADLGMDEESLRDEAYYKLLSERVVTHGMYISDALIEQYIQDHPEEFQSYTKLRIHMILSKTRAQSESILQELKLGAEFAEIARNKSIDDLTRSDGGDLGWVEEDDPFIDPQLLESAKRLEVEEISSVIELEAGFAVLYLEARHNMSKQTTEQIKEEVRKQLALQEAPSIQQLLRQLRAKYQVKRVE